MGDNWKEFFDVGEGRRIALCGSCDTFWVNIEKLYQAFKARYEAEKAIPQAEKPVVDWAAMPAWANWVAMDEDGEWGWFKDSPRRCHSYWGGFYGHRIPNGYTPSFSGDWQDSLVERPK